MTTRIPAGKWIGLWTALPALWMASAAQAQRPQDNWCYDTTWSKSGLAVTNGGLTTPYGVAIGPNGRIYVGDDSGPRIQVYQADGTFAFTITNGFGQGQTFSQPRGMVTDSSGNLYVADYGRTCVFVFDADGAFIRKVGGTAGSGAGQMSGVYDVGVGGSGDIYVLENGNARVSVFSNDGIYLRKISGYGTLDSQLESPLSIAVSKDDRVYVCMHNFTYRVVEHVYVKEFDRNGLWIRTSNSGESPWQGGSAEGFWMGAASIRVDPSGYVHMLYSIFGHWQWGSPSYDQSPYVKVFDQAWNLLGRYGPPNSAGTENVDYRFPCHAIGSDGTMVLAMKGAKSLHVCRMLYRDMWVPPRNGIPTPGVIGIQQRVNSPLVDIDYHVMDVDDTNVTTGVLVFKDGSQTVGKCIRNLALVEGTATNVGPGITANQPHRITWNSGADWGTSLGTYRVAVLARDDRPNLLDIHYLRLPAGNSMPALTISRSPLIANDYMQVWWWLLATGDSGIDISTNRIVGIGGDYNGQVLYDGSSTTSNGRSYVYTKMNVREASPAEVDWARQAALPGNTNRWTTYQYQAVTNRPMNVNEYGFDTGNWGSGAFWVVPLD